MTIYTVIIIILLLLLNFYLYKRNYMNKQLFSIITIFLVIYISFSMLIYFNNLTKGYEYGILYGDILNSHFCDEYKYFVDSDILLNHLKSGEFINWVQGTLPTYEFIDISGHPSYGNYNIFVILLTILKAIGINSTLNLILFKLVFYIPTALMLYKLSKRFLSEKASMLSVILFSAFPGYLLTNTLLMRDNIIVFLVIAILYSLFNKKVNIKVLIPSLVLLLFFRSYLVLVFAAAVFITYKNTDKLISLKDILFLVLSLVVIYIFTNFNFGLNHSNVFFSFYQIIALQENFASFYGTGIFSIIKLLISTCIQIVFVPLYTNFITSGYIYLAIFSISNIFKIVFSLLFGARFLTLIFEKPKKEIIHLMKFTFYFTLFTSLIVMAKDGYIITRITLIWMPLFIIITLLPCKFIKKDKIFK